MQTFKVVESYLHRAAKDVVAEWLKELSESAAPAAWVTIPPLHFRPGRWYLEYPICASGEGVHQAWDEYDDWRGRCPTYQEVTQAGHRVACVLDLAVVHKGRVACAVEIVHKNPTPQHKRDLLARLGIELIEVSALGVMRHIKRPERLPLWTGRAAA